MISNIIPYLNGQLDTTAYFEQLFELCELIKDSKGKVRPAFWCKKEWSEINDFDKYDGMGYWRKRSDVTIEEVESQVSCSINIDVTIPLKFVAIVPRKKSSADDAYADDRMARTIMKVLTENNQSLRTAIGAKKIKINTNSWSNDNQVILSEEYEGIDITDIRYKFMYLSLDVDIVITAAKDCLKDECDPVTTLLCSLIDGATAADIRQCLVDAGKLNDVCQCPVFVNATVFKSAGVVVVASLPSGGSFNIPLHNIFESDGATVVASEEFNVDFTIQSHDILRPDGVTIIQSDEFNVDYTTDPSIFTCQELNNDLTQAQRDVINQSITGKTGQFVSFAAGDDGDLELGRGVDFITLDCDNVFGNTARFTDSVGAQNYDGTGGSLVDYIIDHLIGLGWYRVKQGTSNWATAISNANASVVAGFADWRIPNRNELNSVMNRGVARPLNYAPFNLESGAAATVLFWMSTTHPANATMAFMAIVNHATQPNAIHRTDEQAKANSRNYIFCRNHF